MTEAAQTAQTTPTPDETATTETETNSTAESAETSTEESATESADDKASSTTESEGVPDKYDLKMPDDSPLKAEKVDEIAAYARKQGLSQEKAQELLEQANDSAVKAVEAFKESQHEALEAKSKEWVEQVRVDKEIGGEKFEENSELAARVIRKFATEGFVNELNQTGLGNHPELVRIFVRIGRAMAPDSLVLSGQELTGKKSAADILYGDNDNKDDD